MQKINSSLILETYCSFQFSAAYYFNYSLLIKVHNFNLYQIRYMYYAIGEIFLVKGWTVKELIICNVKSGSKTDFIITFIQEDICDR